MWCGRNIKVLCCLIVLIVCGLFCNFISLENAVDAQPLRARLLETQHLLQASQSEVQSLKSLMAQMQKQHASKVAALQEELESSKSTQTVHQSTESATIDSLTEGAQVQPTTQEFPVAVSDGGSKAEKGSCKYITFLSRLKPVPCIEYLGRMAQKYFYQLGKALEIIPTRNTSKHNSESWKEGWKGDFDSVVEMRLVEGSPDLGKNFHVGDPLILTGQFPDSHFDIIFLRSGSLEAPLSALIEICWLKLRPFGVLSGDAYSDIEDTPFLKNDRFRSVYGNGSNRAVMHTVQDFAARQGVILHATWMKKTNAKRFSCKEKLPAWYIVKGSSSPQVSLDLDTSGSRRAVSRCSAYLQQLSRIPPLPCRDDFRQLVQAKLNVRGRVAEVGVFQGHFSDLNLKVWQGSYYAIDAWRWRPGDPGDKNYQDKESNDRNFHIARKVMAPYNKTGRIQQIRATSEEASRLFPNDYFDWVYVDALHTYAAAKKDMEMWWPKLRPGGFLSGDDYGESKDTEFVPAAAWRETYGPEAVDHDWGVITAAQDFARLTGTVLQITWLAWGPKAKCYKFPAWYMIKPFN